jgi:hypothetical protein
MAAPAKKYHLFHQNMRVFGGGSTERNDGFEEAMKRITTLGTSTDRVLVAGWTEVMNAGVSDSSLKKIAACLDSQLTSTYFYACGVTCGKSESPEYVCISTHQDFKPTYWGRVLNKEKDQWTCYTHDECATNSWPYKGQVAADARGLGYVGGTISGKKFIFGFMHNMYNLGDRSAILSKCQKMMEGIRTKHKEKADVPIVFGGDWNVKPTGKKDPTRVSPRTKVFVTYAVKDDGKGGKKVINTTLKHAYDYWLASYKIDNACAMVHDESRDVDANLSDHAGVSLLLL